jgi:hypothetical protein
MKGCLIVILIVAGAFWYWGSGEDGEDEALAYINGLPEIKALLQDADHVDVKTVESEVGLRRFLSSMMAYQPWWVTRLYQVRGVLVRVLGMKQEGLPQPVFVRPDEVPMTKGAMLSFFKVVEAREKSFWIGQATDKHLSAHLGVIREPRQNKPAKFHVLTVVHYKNWAGPVYFNIIRPFHHFIAKRMAKEGARGAVVL